MEKTIKTFFTFLNFSKIIIFLLIKFSYSYEILDYTEKNWPQSCKGRNQIPINFPNANQFKYNISNYFEILDTNYKKINEKS